MARNKTDSDSDEEEGPQYESQTTQHKGPVHMQFFADEKIVRVERIISSSWSLTAKQEDVRLEEQTTLFGGIFDRKARNPTYFLARIKVGGFHPADGTYDVEYLEDIIMNGIKDQQAKRISHAKIRDVPVDFRVFVFSIILSIINFVSDLYYITFASYKHDSLRWISLGLLFLPVVNFVVLDFSEFRTIIFVQFFWGIAENASRSVFQAIDSIRGQKVSADEVRNKLFLTTTAVTTFFKNQAEILVCVGDADAKRLTGKLVTGVGIAPGTKVVAVRDQPVETAKPAESVVDNQSLAAVDAKVRVVTLSCQAFSSGSYVTFHLVDPGAYHSSFEKIIEQHSLRHSRQFLLLPLASFWDGVIYHCFSAAHYFLKSTMAMLWGIDKLSTLIFNALLAFGSMLSCFLAKHEKRRSNGTATGVVEEIGEDGWCVVNWRRGGATIRVSRHHVVDLEEKKHKGSGDTECGQGWDSITGFITDSITTATAINTAAISKTSNIKVSSKVKLRCFSEKKITSLMNSAYLERAVFQEQSLFDILFVMAQHRRVLFDVTVFKATDWDDAPKFPPIILSNCYFVCVVVSMYMGLGLVALLMALMKTAILITKLASLVLYPALLVFNVFSVVMLYPGGFFLSTLAFLMSIFSIVIVTVFTIHLKLFGFPVVGEKFFARKSDSNIALGEMTTCIDSSALVLKDIQDTVVSVSNTVSAASTWVCSDEAEGQGSNRKRYIVDAHALDPNIKALNRAIYSEMIFEAVPQLVVTCLNAALTGGEQSSAFIITILSSSITFVYNTLPYGYYIFYKDTFTSSEWKNQEGLNGICSKAYYFITEEISYRINRTPRFNVADMDPVTLGDPDKDFNLYAGLTALVISSVFLLFGVQTFYVDGPYALGCFLMVVFGLCFGVAALFFNKCSDSDSRVWKFVGSAWSASSHFLYSWSFLVSTILFFLFKDGYATVPTALTAFAPVLIMAVLHFATTVLLLLNDMGEYLSGKEKEFKGFKTFVYFSFNYSLWALFVAVLGYKIDNPVDSAWIPWRGVAGLAWGLLVTGISVNTAQFEGVDLKIGYSKETRKLHIWHVDIGGFGMFLLLMASPTSPMAGCYLIFGVPFVVGFSIFAWAQDLGLSLPMYCFFLFGHIWAPFMTFAFLLGASTYPTLGDFFESGLVGETISHATGATYGFFISWWQSMLVSFVASQSNSLVSSYSLVMIPTYLTFALIAAFHTVGFFQSHDETITHRYVKTILSGDADLLFGVFMAVFLLGVGAAALGPVAALGVLVAAGIIAGGTLFLLVIFSHGALYATNHFLFTLTFAISTVLFFAYLDGSSLVPTCLTAFAPLLLNVLVGVWSGLVCFLRACCGTPSGKFHLLRVYFLLMNILWAFFLSSVAYKLDDPVGSAWIQWRGLAGLVWCAVLVGILGAAAGRPWDQNELFQNFPLTRYWWIYGLPFAVGFSIYAWKQDVGGSFPTYSYFIMQQVWSPVFSIFEFLLTLGPEFILVGGFTQSCSGMFFSWWQSMLIVFVHDGTYPSLTKYSLVLIPTYLGLFLSVVEHIITFVDSWDFYTNAFDFNKDFILH